MLLGKMTDMNLYQFGICIQNRGLKNILSTRDCTCKAGTHFPFTGIFRPGGQETLQYFQVFTFIYDGLANIHC